MAERILATARASMEIAAPPERVFDAWLDPRKLTKFMAAGTMTATIETLEPREGGLFRILMAGTGETLAHTGRYVVIDRPRRLVFTWVSAGSDWRLSLVTVTFTPTPMGVRVDLLHEGLPDQDRADRHSRGWGTIFNKLNAAL